MSEKVTYFLNEGPDPSHFAHHISRHTRLREAKAMTTRTPSAWGWTIIRAEDGSWRAGPRRVVAASSLEFRLAAQAWCDRVNEANGAVAA